MTKNEINDLLGARDKILEDDYESKEIDTMAETVKLALVEDFSTLEVDFILECCSRLGEAPNLVYDDNGMWAVSGTGMNEVVVGNELIEGAMHTIVEKDMWYPTIREALLHYLTFKEEE